MVAGPFDAEASLNLREGISASAGFDRLWTLRGEWTFWGSLPESRVCLLARLERASERIAQCQRRMSRRRRSRTLWLPGRRHLLGQGITAARLGMIISRFQSQRRCELRSHEGAGVQPPHGRVLGQRQGAHSPWANNCFFSFFPLLFLDRQPEGPTPAAVFGI